MVECLSGRQSPRFDPQFITNKIFIHYKLVASLLSQKFALQRMCVILLQI